MVRGETLSEIARNLKIQNFTVLPSEERNKGRNKDSNLEDALESLTGKSLR